MKAEAPSVLCRCNSGFGRREDILPASQRVRFLANGPSQRARSSEDSAVASTRLRKKGQVFHVRMPVN